MAFVHIAEQVGQRPCCDHAGDTRENTVCREGELSHHGGFLLRAMRGFPEPGRFPGWESASRLEAMPLPLR